MEAAGQRPEPLVWSAGPGRDPRIRALLQRQGIHVEVAPRPESRPRSLWERFWAVMREALSYLAWQAGMG